jgi:uncharacterized protein (TIRG00374 family)
MKNKYFKGGVFFLIGVALFWYVYRDIDFHSIGNALNELKYGWVLLSFIIGLLSHVLRAVRWKMLIEPLNYKPRTINLFLSVLIMYFMNLVIPRGGEVVRCVVVSKYEKIPIVKLIGTVFVERITDLLTFVLIFIGVFFWQFDNVRKLFLTLTLDFSGSQSKITIAGILILVLAILYAIVKKFGLLVKFSEKVEKIKDEIKQGIKSILQIRNKWAYLAATLLIFLLWLFMLYVIFFAYTPTNNMSFAAAIFAYTIGTFAFLLPIQAGMGVWHFLIIQSLFWFGLDKESGMMFALIAHTFTNLVYLIFGSIGFVIMPMINNKEV